MIQLKEGVLLILMWGLYMTHLVGLFCFVNRQGKIFHHRNLMLLNEDILTTGMWHQIKPVFLKHYHSINTATSCSFTSNNLVNCFRSYMATGKRSMHIAAFMLLYQCECIKSFIGKTIDYLEIIYSICFKCDDH